MHILYLHQYFCPPGGSGNDRSLQFSRYWSEAGHKVTVITSDAYFPEDQKLRDGKPALMQLSNGFTAHVLPVNYSHHMRFTTRIHAWIKFYRAALQHARTLTRPDLIYASSTPLTVGELGRKLSHHWHVPFVFETVDVWPDVPEGMGILRNSMLLHQAHRRTERIYAEAARIVALSEGMKDQILSHGVLPSKVMVVHNGTDPEAFACEARPPRTMPVALYAGTVGVANDLTKLLDAFKIVEQRGAKLKLRIVGGGNDIERVKGHAADLGLRHVEFLPPVPKEEVKALLQDADIGVVCFGGWKVLEANSANKFYDYLAAGLPVATNYEGWQANYLRVHQCGLSAPQNHAAALAENLIQLASDPGLRARMGESGVALARAKFDRRNLAADLLRAFQEIVNTVTTP